MDHTDLRAAGAARAADAARYRPLLDRRAQQAAQSAEAVGSGSSATRRSGRSSGCSSTRARGPGGCGRRRGLADGLGCRGRCDNPRPKGAGGSGAAVVDAALQCSRADAFSTERRAAVPDADLPRCRATKGAPGGAGWHSASQRSEKGAARVSCSGRCSPGRRAPSRRAPRRSSRAGQRSGGDEAGELLRQARDIEAGERRAVLERILKGRRARGPASDSEPRPGREARSTTSRPITIEPE